MKTTVKIKSNPNALKKVINEAVKKSSFNISCPNCHTGFQIQGSQFGSRISCPFCHQSIMLNDSGFNNDVNKLQRNFDRTFR